MDFHPIIPWLGGKRRLARSILPQFPPHSYLREVGSDDDR
jgi:site-specific DNA-adenine methylase